MKRSLRSKMMSLVLIFCMILSVVTNVLAEDEHIPVIETLGESVNFYDGGLSDEEIEALSRESMLLGQRSRSKAVNVTFENGRRIDYGNWSTNIMYMIVDGQRNLAYCLEPAYGTPMNGDYAGQVVDNNAGLRKGLYYTFGGPGYDEYVARYGHFSSTGAFDDEYVYSHIILSYLYDSNGSAFLGMDDEWVSVVQTRINRISWMPEPPDASISFEKATLTATFDNATGLQRTELQRLIGDSRNTLTIPLPTGVTLHNTTTNTSGAGNVAIKGGDSFYLTGAVLSTNALDWSSGSLYGSLTNQWRSLLMQTVGGLQDIGSWSVDRDPVAPVSFNIRFNGIGRLEIVKRSTNEVFTNDNTYYTLEGATFVIKDNAGNIVDTVVTDAEGKATSAWILQDDYTIEETVAPVGYLKAPNQRITLDSASKEVIVDEEPQIGRILLQKVDKDTGRATAQGNGTLENAMYSITYITTGGTYTMLTDSTGRLAFENLPLGKYIVKEVEASRGYQIDPTIYEVEITSENRTTEIFSHSVRSEEAVIRGGIEVEKRDFELDSAVLQGSATLQGTVLEIINRSENSVVVNGVTYGADEVVQRLVTDMRGRATTSNDLLPYGDYEIREIEPPNGYTKQGIISRVFTIDTHGEMVRLTSTDTAIKNTVIRGGVVVEKWDIELDVPQAQGAGTLEGAKFAIFNDSANAVLVDGVLYEPNTIVATIETNADFVATTARFLLPYGNYRIEEIQAPNGYLQRGELSRSFTIRENGVIVELNTADTAIKNTPLRADLRLVKIEEGTHQRMGNIPFSITSKTTGESHIIVTDKNGMASTASSWNPHTQHTNRGETSKDGVWFGAGAVNDDVGALLYDTYIIDELLCAENEGKILLQGIEIVVDRDGIVIEIGTMTNEEIEDEGQTIRIAPNEGEGIIEEAEEQPKEQLGEVENAKAANAPKTGDDEKIIVWFICTGVALSLSLFAVMNKRRKNLPKS